MVIGPSPTAVPLTVTVPCIVASPGSEPPARHTVVLHPDWSVDVPHDLTSERIAIALGGECSCVGLVDHAIPAARALLALLLRATPPAVHRAPDGSWRASGNGPCCVSGPRFDGAAQAARHERSIPHMQNRFGAPWDVLISIMARCIQAYGPRLDLPATSTDAWRASAACQRGFTDVEYLWDAGIPPRGIVAAHRQTGAQAPLPRDFYCGILAGDVDASRFEPGTGRREPLPAGTPDWATFLGRHDTEEK